VVREGYEGLVRGNEPVEDTQPQESSIPGVEVKVRDSDFVKNLRFGDGALLLDGTGDYPGRRSLKGRYIVRVGWDDVRGWLAEVSTMLDHSILCGTDDGILVGWNSHRYSEIQGIQNS
jgi:6-phosphofructokinase 1